MAVLAGMRARPQKIYKVSVLMSPAGVSCVNPEREIINWWLNKRGFFTINSIDVAQNKEIDILAVKSEKGRIGRVLHIETACSISSVDNQPPESYLAKFDDKLVLKRIKDSLIEYIGVELPYERILVLGNTARIEDFMKLQKVEIWLFRDLLFDVVDNISKQNHRNQVMRTIQLMKYILMSNPENLAKLLERQDANKILKMNTREEFLKRLFAQAETKRILEKEENEPFIVSVLKNSSLSRPEKFARIIETEVMGTRSRKKFVEALLKQEGVQKLSLIHI